MQVHIDFPKRVRTLQAEVARQGIDVLVGTRLKTITHVSGAFVPWRSAVVIPADGEAQLFTVSIADLASELGRLKGATEPILVDVVTTEDAPFWQVPSPFAKEGAGGE